MIIPSKILMELTEESSKGGLIPKQNISEEELHELIDIDSEYMKLYGTHLIEFGNQA